MLAFFVRYRQSIILLLLLVTSLVLMTRHSRDGQSTSSLTTGLFELTAVMESGLVSMVSGTIATYNEYLNLVNTKRENSTLREEVVRLENNLARMHEMEIENLRLKRLLDFQEAMPFVMIPAGVVGKDFNSWSRTLLIHEGSKAGIAPDMAVVRPEGVVGRILSVSPNYSLVLLMIDSKSTIPGIFQRTRSQGIVEGKMSDLCRVKFLDRLADVEIDDVVVSSGLGGLYPKGLVIGRVSSVQKKPYGLFQDVTITPAVDFVRLEEVFVVKNRQLEEYDLQLKRIQE